jgi:hypothetical protein
MVMYSVDENRQSCTAGDHHGDFNDFGDFGDFGW